MKEKLFFRVRTLVCVILGMLVGSTLAQNSDIPSRNHDIPSRNNEDWKTQLAANYGRLPLRFEENQGQTSDAVKYLSRGRGYALFLTPTQAVVSLRSSGGGSDGSTPLILHMRFASATSHPQITSEGLLTGTSNYFLGNDPKNWRAAIPNYSKVRFHNVAPGVDFVFYGTQRQLEYDIVVSPGADPSLIKIAYEGQNKIDVDRRGDLVFETSNGRLVQQKPVLFQVVNGAKRMVEGRYTVTAEGKVGFAVGKYDRLRDLVVDPILSYSTYLGGNGDDEANAIAVDTAGNAYVTGQTQSTNFPTTPSAFKTSYQGNTDAFVTKLNATGTAFVYSTYLGGNGGDIGYGIAADSTGNAYVTGGTTSTNFPTVNPIQTHGGIFLTKLNPAGTALIYSTYFGGTNSEHASAIAIDAAGDAYITGNTASIDFPTHNAFQSVLGGSFDAFVAKFNPAGSAALYSTYLGGAGPESANGIAVDSVGSAYVTGERDQRTSPPILRFNQLHRAIPSSSLNLVRPGILWCIQRISAATLGRQAMRLQLIPPKTLM